MLAGRYRHFDGAGTGTTAALARLKRADAATLGRVVSQNNDLVVRAIVDALTFLTRYVHERQVTDEVADDDVKALERVASYLLDVPEEERPRLIALVGPISCTRQRVVRNEVWASEDADQRLYARHGFIPTGVGRGYYQPSGEGAVITTRRP